MQVTCLRDALILQRDVSNIVQISLVTQVKMQCIMRVKKKIWIFFSNNAWRSNYLLQNMLLQSVFQSLLYYQNWKTKIWTLELFGKNMHQMLGALFRKTKSCKLTAGAVFNLLYRPQVHHLEVCRLSWMRAGIQAFANKSTFQQALLPSWCST